MKNRKQQGFTLIELMIVIAIIAILMAYAIPAYRDYTIKTKLGEGIAMGSGVKTAVSVAYIETGDLAGLNSGAPGIPDNDQPGYCVDTLDVVAGVITANFNCTAGTAGVADLDVDLFTVTMTPNTTTVGGLQWTCTSGYTVDNPARDPC